MIEIVRTTSDLYAVREIERRASATTLNGGWEALGWLFTIEQLREFQNKDQLWVAVEAARAVGFAIALPKEDGYVYLEEIDVLPEETGRGIGKLLLNAVIEWGAASQSKAITLRTFAKVSPATRLYQAAGFTPWDPETLPQHLQDVLAQERELGLLAYGRATWMRKLR